MDIPVEERDAPPEEHWDGRERHVVDEVSPESDEAARHDDASHRDAP